jgi:hypothetical protein
MQAVKTSKLVISIERDKAGQEEKRNSSLENSRFSS